jgi:hypothetical protein
VAVRVREATSSVGILPTKTDLEKLARDTFEKKIAFYQVFHTLEKRAKHLIYNHYMGRYENFYPKILKTLNLIYYLVINGSDFFKDKLKKINLDTTNSITRLLTFRINEVSLIYKEFNGVNLINYLRENIKTNLSWPPFEPESNSGPPLI